MRTDYDRGFDDGRESRADGIRRLDAEVATLRSALSASEARRVEQEAQLELIEDCGHPAACLVHEQGPEDADEVCQWCAEVGAAEQVASYEKGLLESKMSEARKALEAIANRVNDEGDDSQACVSDIGHMARSAYASLSRDLRTDALTSGKAEPSDTSPTNHPACLPSASDSAPLSSGSGKKCKCDPHWHYHHIPCAPPTKPPEGA